jgi:peroxidase
MNQVTSFLELSNVYGFTDEIARTLKTFKGGMDSKFHQDNFELNFWRQGELGLGNALDQTKILPQARLPQDQDKYEMGVCRPPEDRPQLTCFRNGDGIRGSQYPGGKALVLFLVRRHNQHCAGLAKVNPQWNDERLYQEAR